MQLQKKILKMLLKLKWKQNIKIKSFKILRKIVILVSLRYYYSFINIIIYIVYYNVCKYHDAYQFLFL